MLRVLGFNPLLYLHQIPSYSFFPSCISQCNIAILIDIGTEKNPQLINVLELAEEMGKEWCIILFGIYVFMDEDYRSVFKGKWKVTIEETNVVPMVSQFIQVSLRCISLPNLIQ